MNKWKQNFSFGAPVMITNTNLDCHGAASALSFVHINHKTLFALLPTNNDCVWTKYVDIFTSGKSVFYNILCNMLFKRLMAIIHYITLSLKIIL